MSALKSIVLAHQLAKIKRDSLVGQLNRSKKSLLNAQDQMVQLRTYAEETHEKWLLASQVGVSPELMRHHNQFMARLQEAIALQQTALSNFEAEFQRSHKSFMAAELRLASLDLMQKKLQSSLDVIQMRREQKQTDEFAASRKKVVFDATQHTEVNHGY
jgi:flagellar FliJ protein